MPLITTTRRATGWLAGSYVIIGLVVLGGANLVLLRATRVSSEVFSVVLVFDLLYVSISVLIIHSMARFFLGKSRRQEERYRAMVEKLPDPICCWLPDTTLTFVNERYADLFVTSPQKLLGRRWLDLVPTSKRASVFEAAAEIVASGHPRSHIHQVDRGGLEAAWMEWTDIPVVDGRGQLLYVQSIGRDITQRIHDQGELRKSHVELEQSNQERESALKALQDSQQQVIQQERLQALGQMASGIAHDFNNALAVVCGYSEMLLDWDDRLTPNKRRSYLGLIQTAVKDATAVVNRMREFYRYREVQDAVTVIDLNALVDQTIELSRPRWESQPQAKGVTICVERRLQTTRRIAGCESELREALINLIGNAVDSMPHGGTLTVRTADREERVAAEVIDTGIGMTAETINKCTEPFFTTKGVQGTGLGLATVNGTIRRHTGKLDIRSEMGRGTTMSMLFPALAEEARPPRDPIEPTPYDHRGTPLLVVDDNELLCRGLRATLSEMGFAVSMAVSGKQALELYEEGRFAVVITDLAMPDMNGEQLIAAIRRQSVTQPIIMLTGFGEFMKAAGEETMADLLLSKPITGEALNKAITQLLAGRNGKRHEPCQFCGENVIGAASLASEPASRPVRKPSPALPSGNVGSTHACPPSGGVAA